MSDYFQNLDDETVTTYVCENCGLTEELTQAGAFDAGWDYPPFIMPWTTVQPHTCPTCPINTTLWWQLATNAPPEGERASIEDFIATLEQRHQDTWLRIKEEMVTNS